MAYGDPYNSDIPALKNAHHALPPSKPGIYRPHRLPNQNEVEITFYCSEQRMREISELCTVMYGDRDFTKSISRFLTAGVHWMEQHGHGDAHMGRLVRQQIGEARDQRDALLVEVQVLTHERDNATPWWKHLFRRFLK